MSNHTYIQKRFNQIGGVYNLLKHVFMANRPEKVIGWSVPQFRTHSRILIVGGGADNTLIELIQHQKAQFITHLDISAVMSEHARNRLQKHFPAPAFSTHFIVKPFLEFESNVLFDAVVFPFYLDLFTDSEIEQNIQKAYSLLPAKGYVYVIDFAHNTSPSLWQRCKASGLYALFYVITKTKRHQFPKYTELFDIHHLALNKKLQYYQGFYCFWEYQKR